MGDSSNTEKKSLKIEIQLKDSGSSIKKPFILSGSKTKTVELTEKVKALLKSGVLIRV